MKHAREDYNKRIVDLENLIPEDEPVFLLRGQDEFAARAVEFYADSLSEERAQLEREYQDIISSNILEPNDISRAKDRIDDLLDVELKSRIQASNMRMWPTKKIPDIHTPIEIQEEEHEVPDGINHWGVKIE